ncbi:hypothetical protein Y1Q_0006135 [Alligator mississippiensis]|uniref:Uncharacterized protein n=1 Tax=Alligator mississippiensis TaxID=8496 RepID=A0A151N4M5_ALLMI|nr:hypothetical protein Y1Q_0006135 [Alligator mississippiensis]
MADGARGVRGRGAPGREKPNEFLSDTQKATTTHHLSLQELQKSWTQPRDWEGSSLFKGEIETRFSPYTRESPTIDDLEESLRQLKVQVDSLASSLSFDTDQDYTLDSGTADGSTSPTAQEINERFLQTLAEGAVGRSLIEMSPYEKELARLRLERLRMEEEWLLELKRQQELERTRGPKPKCLLSTSASVL